MDFQRIEACEVEQERVGQAKELIAESGPDWASAYLPGSYGCHELLDRVALLSQQVEINLLCHPACIVNPSWYLLAEQAAALRDLYQQVGAEHLGSEAAPGQRVRDVPA